MSQPRSALEKTLVAYYAFIQAAHLIALIRAAVLFFTTGDLVFPAPPPPAGWTDQARYFLLTLGALDTLLLLLSFAFVAGYAFRAPWHAWLGLVTLSAFIASALAFAGGTLPAGAWAAHPAAYLSLVLAFLPVPALFLLLVRAAGTPAGSAPRSGR